MIGWPRPAAETLTLESRRMVAAACERFQAAWRDGLRPAIETYLEGLGPAERTAALRELIALETALRTGEGDRPTLRELLDRFPEDAQAVTASFSSMQGALTTEGATGVAPRESSPEATEPLGGPSGASETANSGATIFPGDRDTGDESTPLWLGRYQIERPLGRGGFGRVFLAKDSELDRHVAIKVPLIRAPERPDQLEALLAEARLAAGLRHPGIVAVHDVGREDDGSAFVVLEYIEGTTLADVMRRGRIEPVRLAAILAQVAEAVHHAHRAGLIHRDLKPSNIMIDEQGVPRVTDFGLAITESAQRERAGEVAGTPTHMAPEQVRGEAHRLDGRTDIWALGVILYQGLTGRPPFAARDPRTLFDEILHREPKPPRQIDDSVPKELERICLKSMAKRMTDRYSSALDLAEDLRAWLDAARSPVVAAPETATRPDAELPPGAPRIVPRGLRTFEREDADFFLDLLPGPRDRDGLPDSIRFWKTRVEETDPERTFAVGMLYGPSGCGKSSLVKAGLIPRLSGDVLAIYVEATADETESRILHRLRRQVPRLASESSLAEAIAGLRRGSGKKIVVFLDQFEQWLHGRTPDPDSELVTALRQCDGGNVQCVLMVRDDFGMAAYRFMRELETRIIEGQNFATVDLFDVDHARSVLAQFGRAFGRLPALPNAPSPEQDAFLAAAASGLAHEGKVVSVRLALFAEMVKAKPWVPATLDAVGGTTGIGINFLEEAFAGREANPEHRAHQPAARAVLRSLLPEAGTDIKGNMRSHSELFRTSGCGDKAEFGNVLRILDGELRLITPTDPDGSESDPGRDAAGRYYQLTHDYLVPSLRNWLTRKQKETRRGRAELRLSECAANWDARPENRRLPTWLEYAGILLLTRRRSWSLPERRMMHAAARFHGLRFGTAFFLSFALAASLRSYVADQRRSLADQKREGDRQRAELAVDAVMKAPADAVPYAIRNLEPLREHAVRMLQREFDRAAPGSPRRLRAAVSLAAFGDLPLEYLLAGAGTAPPDECANLVEAIDHDRDAAIRSLQPSAARADAEKDYRLKARLSVLLLQLGEPGVARQMFELGADPTQRTLLIDSLATWHGAVDRLVANVADSEPPSSRSGVCSGIGAIPPNELPPSEIGAAAATLVEWYRNQPDGGTHGAAGWALRRWNQTLPEIAASAGPRAGFQWHVNSLGMTMMLIPAGHPAALARRDDARSPDWIEGFWLCDRETSRALFQRFVDDPVAPAAAKPVDWTGAALERSPTMGHPVQNVSWHDAILFCNWLSRKEGRTPCYVGSTEAWELDEAADGYRLPTEVEWEYACRAGATTRFAFGDDDALLGRYAVFQANRTEVCGSKIPNGWGLFDLHGNVYEWCQDRYPPPKGGERILRGGAFDYPSFKAAVPRREGNRPTYRSYTIGFRVARSNR